MLSERDFKLISELHQDTQYALSERVSSADLGALLNAARQQGRDERKDGWVNVPVQPTEAMSKAYWDRVQRNGLTKCIFAEAAWDAMLSAAPAPEGDGA